MSLIKNAEADSLERRRARERRAAERHNTRGAPVSIDHESGTAVALCGDVSRSGARLSLDRPLAVGETVTVSFGPDVMLTGRVAWVERAECGIEFDEVADGPAAAYRVSQGLGTVPATTSAQTPTRTFLTTVNGNTRFRDGLRVTMVLPDYERKAILRWTQDNFASVTLQS